MNILESLNRGLEQKYHLNEAKEDKERFKSFVNDDDLYDRFELLKSKQIIKGQESDYTYWEKQSLDALRDFIEKTEAQQEEKNKERTATKQRYKEISNLKKGKDYNLIYKGNGWTIYEILTHKASQWFGRDTKWCITMKDNNSYFNDYKSDGADFYFLIPDKNPETDKWCYLYYGKDMFCEPQERYRDNEYDYDYDAEDEKEEPTFWDAEDNEHYFENLCALIVGLNIPISVLAHLPGISQKDINSLNTLNTNIEDARKNGYVYTPQDTNEYIIKLNPTKIIVPEGVDRIENEAFKGCENLKEIQISNSVEEIGDCAFEDCKSLQEIIIPNSVKQIGRRAFRGCFSLNNIVVSNSVKYLKKQTFSFCTSLKEIIIPNSVEEIDMEGFYYCTSLKEIIIPNSVKQIGKDAFRDCWALNNIVVSNSIKEIREGTFNNCYSLKEIEIPNGVKEIGWGTFYCCRALQKIFLPSSVEEIDGLAFACCHSLKEADVKGEYRPEMLKNADLNDDVILNWIDCGIKERYGDAKKNL